MKLKEWVLPELLDSCEHLGKLAREVVAAVSRKDAAEARMWVDKILDVAETAASHARRVKEGIDK